MAKLLEEDRLAVVFHGIIGGMSGRNGIGPSIDMEICAKVFKHQVLNRYPNDVFIHSWSVDHGSVLNELYNPISSLYQPQEYFRFKETQNLHADTGDPQAFRTMSRYTSLHRAMELKRAHEYANGFKYKWVFAARFDLIFFTPLDLTSLSPADMHICGEPHWGGFRSHQIHDIIFISSSVNMDKYATLVYGLYSGRYPSHIAHQVVHDKFMRMFNQSIVPIKVSVDRYKNVEIYRFIMHPEQNTVGHQWGALETKGKLFALLDEIGVNYGKT